VAQMPLRPCAGKVSPRLPRCVLCTERMQAGCRQHRWVRIERAQPLLLHKGKGGPRSDVIGRLVYVCKRSMHGNIIHHDNLHPCSHAHFTALFRGVERACGCRGVAGAASATNWHSRADTAREAHWPCRAHGDGGVPPRRGQQCAEVAHVTHLAAAVGNQVRHQMACLYMVVVIPSSTQLDAACHANQTNNNHTRVGPYL
jgi:hypothetical protein